MGLIGTIHFPSGGPAVTLERYPQGGTSMTNIGIAPQERQTIASQLSKLLADTYSLYLKTHSFHWNVTGPQFSSLHAMFETQYNELWLAADEIAERIRTLDVFAPGSYSQFGKLTSIKAAPGVPDS